MSDLEVQKAQLDEHAQKLEAVQAQLKTSDEHMTQHRGLLDELREKVKGYEDSLESALRNLAPKPVAEIIEQAKAFFEPAGSLAALETFVKAELVALEQKYMAKVNWDAFLSSLEKRLNDWMQANLAELEQKTIAIVKRELAPLAPTVAAPLTAAEMPALQPGDVVPAPTPTASADPTSPEAWPPFRSKEEHVAQGFYADTYEFQKAEYEARKAAALGAVEQQEASTPAAASSAAPETV